MIYIQENTYKNVFIEMAEDIVQADATRLTLMA